MFFSELCKPRLIFGTFLGNPALRHGKPGHGLCFGYGVRFKSHVGHFQVDYAVNAFQQATVYFGFSNAS